MYREDATLHRLDNCFAAHVKSVKNCTLDKIIRKKKSFYCGEAKLVCHRKLCQH